MDYSTLNNEKKTLHDGGESSQTFFGMFEWVKKATPTPRHSTARLGTAHADCIMRSD